MQNNIVRVVLWGKEVGSLYWDDRRKRSVFTYHPDFLKEGIDISPLSASIKNPRNRLPIYGMPNDDIFCGLPAFIADSLPGRWGNAVFDAWAAENHIRASEITSVDKLLFIGKRGMGALEFEPAEEFTQERSFELSELYKKAMEILQGRENVTVAGDDLSLNALYEVGTSAGGNHSKAVIAINRETGEIRSGQVMLPAGFTYYLMKFAENNYYPLTKVEMVYAEMARDVGITMMPAELIDIDGESHFLTERYDRKEQQKIHTVSLAGMNPEASSYEQLMEVCIRLGLPYKEREETFRRAVFNILTCNVDAHIRNFEFMMEQGGEWHITPAFDLTFSCFNPGNKLDAYHYLSMNGRRTSITCDDMLTYAHMSGIDRPDGIIKECVETILNFRSYAEKYAISEYWQDVIERHFAEMSPGLLSGLHGYLPHVFSFMMGDVYVEDAQWVEMGNGAMRLTAKLNGQQYRATFSAKSPNGKRAIERGGAKMAQEDLRQFVEELFQPRYRETHALY
ncbi:MAG: type II toxin-antitoxin system HipA family toxin [Bacteroidaceae bacterium]|nr:type II toxin-antitoxin system HipA family toxin [Bacteroidaceae bacterium]